MTATRWNTALILLALWLAEATGAFETAMIYAAFKALIVTFHDPAKVGWLVTAFLLVSAGGAAVVGRLGDLYGRRRVILWLLAAGALGAAVSASATSFAVLLVGRSIEGLSAAILPLVIGLVRENLRRERVALGIGLMISGASAGTAAGLVIGGVIVDHFSWHAVFLASTSFAVLSFGLVLALVPRSHGTATGAPLDWLGGVLFVPAVAGLLLYVSNGRGWGWTSAGMIALLIGSAALLALWIVQSLRKPDPLIDIRLFADRRVLVANVIGALVAMGALQITLVFSVLLQAPRWTGIGLGASATLAGLAKLPSNLGSLFAGPLGGYLTERRGARLTMIGGGLLATLGWLLAMWQHGSVAMLVAVLCVISFGTTILFAVGPTLLVAAVPSARTSEAAAMMGVVRQIFIAIGAQLVAVLLATDTLAGPDGARYPTANAFMLTMGVIVALCALATLVALALPRRIHAGLAPAVPPASA
ncbi:MFS transporter [Sphingomonas bacterium]|uniref:MFS transporter n=1 Tax=Sphingomonas bacterium TaxID=1895847 RepID=UPI0015771C44|nr:MFS transporter [Sphingomonas bacterium]